MADDTAERPAAEPQFEGILCSRCFVDDGLSRDAQALGVSSSNVCSHCGSTEGRKLDKERLLALADTFFVRGTLVRARYGAAPVFQFNEHHFNKTNIAVDERLRKDAELLGQHAGIGFFHYGPRLWMLGEVEPLKQLHDSTRRPAIIEQIIAQYPGRLFWPDERLARLRKNPEHPAEAHEYDSPPSSLRGLGRLDSEQFPVLYASQDVEVCIHECRVTVEDALFMATLAPTRPIRCLDLTEVLQEDNSEFDSLDLAIHMLFLAEPHAYDVCRAIAAAARTAGFDGIVYPSYYSMVRTGARPFDTALGISVRRFPGYRDIARTLSIPDVAVFGSPIQDGLLRVTSVNRLVLRRVLYDFHFGPASVTRWSYDALENELHEALDERLRDMIRDAFEQPPDKHPGSGAFDL